MPKDKAYLIAEAKIEEARQSNATELDFRGEVFGQERLGELPASIGQLTRLRKLQISRHHLTALPDSLGNLPELESLDLSSNRLTALPGTIGKLTKLQVLELSHNGFKELPESISQLIHLRTLNVFGGQLSALPDGLAHLSQLRSINLANNRVRTLPEWLGRLPQLELLQFSFNKLTILPDSLGDLAHLELLYVANNEITALPTSLGRLGQLQSLDVSNNQLREVPTSLGELHSLRALNLGGNQLAALPESLAKLTSLENLNLSANKLTVAPSWLGGLTKLTSLNLSANGLTKIPETVRQLTALNSLDLASNSLTEVPDFFAPLKQLESLDLFSNGLTTLPDSLGALESVTRPNLSNNPLISIPDSFIQGASNVTILSELGWVFYGRDKHELALKLLVRALELDPKNKLALIWRSAVLVSMRRFEEAQIVSDEALRLWPDDEEVLNERGWLYKTQKDFEKAIDAFDQALSTNKENRYALVQRVSCLRLLRRFDHANAQIEAALKLFPSNAELLEEAGQLAVDQDKFEDAIKSFDQALKTEPHRVSAALAKVGALSRLNRDGAAFDVLRDLQARWPEDPAVMEGLGFFHLNRNDSSTARRVFSAWLDKHPDDIRAINGLGAVAYDESRFDEAVAFFTKAVELASTVPTAYANVGWALAKQEPQPDLKQAKEFCHEALKREPRHPSALGCLGLIAFKGGRLREAEDYFRSSIDSDKSQGHYADLGALYVLMGRYEDAETTLKDAVKFQKNDPQPRLELANLYLQTGRTKEAVRECRQVTAIAPNSEAAPRALAIALIGADDYGEAEKVLREAIRKQDDSKRWRLHLTLSQLLTRLADKTSEDGLYEEALKEVQIAIGIKPNAAELYFQKGILRSKAKDPRGALRDFKECVRLDANHYEAERYARLVGKQIRDDVHRGSKWASWTLVGIGMLLLFSLWYQFLTQTEPTVPATVAATATPSPTVASAPAKDKADSAPATAIASPSATESKAPDATPAQAIAARAAESLSPRPIASKARVSDTVLTIMTPLLLGMIVVGFLLPALVRLKFAGVEAELTQPKEVISTGPGEVSLGGSLSTIKS
jgi:Leucine-rich repeat (LRR) protein/Tfp pilus assembly protein PilF